MNYIIFQQRKIKNKFSFSWRCKCSHLATVSNSEVWCRHVSVPHQSKIIIIRRNFINLMEAGCCTEAGHIVSIVIKDNTIVLLNFQWVSACGRCTVQWPAVLEWPLLVSLSTWPLSPLSMSVNTKLTHTVPGSLLYWLWWFFLI